MLSWGLVLLDKVKATSNKFSVSFLSCQEKKSVYFYMFVKVSALFSNTFQGRFNFQGLLKKLFHIQGAAIQWGYFLNCESIQCG